MGSFYGKHVARSLVTGAIVITVLVTTFLPGWADTSRAVDLGGVTEVSAGYEIPEPDLSGPAAEPMIFNAPVELTPLNALVLADADHQATIEAAIRAAGDKVYVVSGDAIYAGLDGISETRLMALGARGVYQGLVPESALLEMSVSDRAAVEVWNAVASDANAPARDIVVSDAVPTATYLSPMPTTNSSTSHAPADDQTSVFMAGDIAVKVLFVESETGPENWTTAEINEIKTEVTQALDWWTVASTKPATPNGPPRPDANLTWSVSYVSPFDGATADRLKIRVNSEPIQSSIATGASDNNWMAEVAADFTGLPASDADAALRKLADDTRGTRDWGFTIFVVDSSTDPDGRFDGDGKVAGAALNGPWAVVTYDGGDLGAGSVEIVLAKMIGHVFGAGNEGYDELQQIGCHQDEFYGYLHVPHSNCERDNSSPEPSLMRAGVDMIQGYKDHDLSDAARAQVGWLDSDKDGSYDVIDTLTDSFNGFVNDPVCPIIHVGGMEILNEPAYPAGFEGEPAWNAMIWDDINQEFNTSLNFTPVNINRPGFVWASINDEDWVEAQALDGNFNSENESYTVTLTGTANADNTIHVAIMNRWEQQNDLDADPVVVSLPAVPNFVGDLFESDDDTAVSWANSVGIYPWGWTPDVNGLYSGGSTMIANGPGSNICFGFEGTEVSVVHSMLTSGSANVYVDGKLHSTITYSNLGVAQQMHLIGNLNFGVHTVMVEAVSGTIDVDAFFLSDDSATRVIDGVADVGSSGFIENNSSDLEYIGDWTPNVPLTAPGRPGSPDGFAHRTTHANDRMTFTFTNADTIAIYRAVFANGGSADVFVDGEYRGTMNNDADVARVLPHYIGGFDPAAEHTVEVVMKPGSPRLDLESVRFLNFTGGVAYGNQLWSKTTAGAPLEVPYDGTEELYGVWEPINNKYYRVNEEGALATLFFEGSAAAVTISGGGKRGIFELYLDGKLVRTVDSSSQGGSNLQLIAGGVSPDHPHTLQIRHVNVNPLSPKDNRIYGYQVYYVPVADGDVQSRYEESQYDVEGDPTWSNFLFDGKWKFKYYKYEPGPSADRYAESGSTDARTFFYFTNADTITLYGRGKGYGAAEVYVDGEYQGLFYQKSKANWQAPFTASGFDPDQTHVVELRVHNEKGFAKKFNLDWVLIHGRPVLGVGTYEQDAMVPVSPGLDGRAIQFTGAWTDVSDVRASGASHTSSSKTTWNIKKEQPPVVEATFEVTGATSVVLYRHMHKTYGMADVYVDGKYHSSFDSYVKVPSDGAFKEPYTIAGLDPGFNHVITITPQPQGKNGNKYDAIDVDYIVVRGTEAVDSSYLEDGHYENNDITAKNGGAIVYAGDYWTGTTGTVSSTTARGDKAVVTFYGNTFQVFVNLVSGAGAGTADIYIDGVLKQTYKMKGTGTNVPVTIPDLEEKFHVAEIVLAKGGEMHLNAFAAWTVQPLSGPQGLDFQPLNANVYQTGNWYSVGVARETRERYAAMHFFVTGVDTLMLTYQGGSKIYGDIEVYVDGKPHTTIDLADIKSGAAQQTYMIAGLGPKDEGHWIEIYNPKPKAIGLVQIELTNIADVAGVTPLGAGQKVEGEGAAVLERYGSWLQRPGKPNSKFSGNYYMQMKSKHVHMYIPVQGINYLTVYRVTGLPGDVDVYIDGEFWGTMYNKGKTESVPFTIGPIPNPTETHIVDLREAKKGKKFAVDYVVGLGLEALDLGWYENTDPAFAGAYTGNWTLTADGLASGGSYHRGTGKARLDAIFYGNKITIYRHNWKYAKAMEVWVDGTPYTLYGKENPQRYNVAHTILLPNTGPHSLEIISLSGKNDFDALHIENVAPAYYGAYQHTDDMYVALNGPSGSFDWVTGGSGTASGGSYAWTGEKYTSASFMFYGDDVTAYWQQDENWGKMLIYLDGVFIEEFDQHAYFADPYYSYSLNNLGRDTHVLEFRFEGKRGKGKKQVNFDGFAVDSAYFPRPGDVDTPTLPSEAFLAEPGCYEELEPQWTYVGPHSASWFTYQAGAASGGKYRQGAGNAGDELYAEVTLNETDGFALVYKVGPTGGIAEILIDYAVIDTIDMYSPTDQWQQVYTYSGAPLDPNVTYSLQVRFTGTANAASDGTTINIDTLHVPGYPACP